MKKFKTSLRGYAPAAVRQYIAESQENHRLRIQELQEQIKLLEEERLQMEDELRTLAESETKQPAVLSDQLVSKRLLEAHSIQTETVWQALRELKEQDERLQTEEEERNAERIRMLEDVERRLRDTLGRIAEGGHGDERG